MRAYRKIEDGYESKLEPGRMVLLGIGILLTVVLVFLVGVLVGKGLWASKSSGPAAQAEGRPEPAPGAAAGGPKYTFYDELKQPDSREIPAPSPLPPSASDTATTPIAASRAEPQPESSKTDLAPSPTAATGGVATRPAPEQASAQAVEKHASGATKPPFPAPAERPEPAKVVTETTEATKPVAEKKARPSPAPESTTKEKTPAQTQPKKDPPKEAEKKSAEKPAINAKEVSQTEAKSKPAASPKPEAKLPTASFTVQIGSYKEKGPAEKQVREMAAQGIDAHVLAVPIQGRTWYRVQVGQFATRAEAEGHFKKKLKPKGVQGFVTPR